MKRWEKWAFVVILVVLFGCFCGAILCGLSGEVSWPRAGATALFAIVVAAYAVIAVRSVMTMRRGIPKERW